MILILQHLGTTKPKYCTGRLSPKSELQLRRPLGGKAGSFSEWPCVKRKLWVEESYLSLPKCTIYPFWHSLTGHIGFETERTEILFPLKKSQSFMRGNTIWPDKSSWTSRISLYRRLTFNNSRLQDVLRKWRAIMVYQNIQVVWSLNESEIVWILSVPSMRNRSKDGLHGRCTPHGLSNLASCTYVGDCP